MASMEPSGLAIRPADDCRWDIVALGEVMLRLDPGEGRIATTRRFACWEGGGEYNVARGLARVFGLRAGIVSALADNPIGRLIEDLIRQGGVDQSHVRWVPFDGVGRTTRNGLNFTERGHGVRAALGVYDRGHTAASQMRAGEIDWDHLFGSDGVRWFHTGGIYAALSETTPGVVTEAIAAARRHGTIVSYDLNYRPSLWRSIGGQARAQAVNREIVGGVRPYRAYEYFNHFAQGCTLGYYITAFQAFWEWSKPLFGLCFDSAQHDDKMSCWLVNAGMVCQCGQITTSLGNRDS